MNKGRTPFEILGVTPADDLQTIRLAWRAKVRRLHPDHAQNKTRATAQLAEVNAAFDALQGHVPRRVAHKAPDQDAKARASARAKAARKRRDDAVARGRRRAEADLAMEQRKQAARQAAAKSPMSLRVRAAAGYAKALKSLTAA